MELCVKCSENNLALQHSGPQTTLSLTCMSRIEHKYCLISTSYLEGLFYISHYFIFDRIVCVLVMFYQWGHFVMLIIKNLNLINIQSWTYLKIYVGRFLSLHGSTFKIANENVHQKTLPGFLTIFLSLLLIIAFDSMIILACLL